MSDHIEKWRTIIGFEDYQVSNLGRVRSLKNHNVYYLNPMIRGYEGQQYKCVKLFNNRNSQVFAVHRLVAMAFIDNPNNYPVVNHKDEDKLNNEASNLEWCTQQYNCTYNGIHIKRGLKLRNRNDLSKPVEMYSLDGELLKIFPSLREAGRFVGKSNNISDITNCCKGYKKDGIPVYSAYGYIWKWKRVV